MIKPFGDKATEALFRDNFVRAFQSIARPAKRKLVMLDAATRLADLLVPPSNRLEALQGGTWRRFMRSASTINGDWSSAGLTPTRTKRA